MSSDRKKQQTVIADIGEMKADWLRWCDARGLTSSAGLRGLVSQALAGEAPLQPAMQVALRPDERGLREVAVLPQQDQGPRVGREIYFTASEHAAIEAASAALGMGYHEIVIAAVRGALAKLSTFGQAELEAVTESNRQLAQVVMDLGALRRAGVPDDYQERLTELESAVRIHVETVSKLMATGARRWEIKIS